MTDIPDFMKPKHKPKYRGVVWHVRQRQWRVKVRKHDRVFYKEFKDQEVAARVRDVAAIMVHGLANCELNFDGEPPPGITKIEIYGWLRKAGVPCSPPARLYRE